MKWQSGDGGIRFRPGQAIGGGSESDRQGGRIGGLPAAVTMAMAMATAMASEVEVSTGVGSRKEEMAP